jgi:hypothetical protein
VEIYTIAGSQAEIDLFETDPGIPRNRVFNCQYDSFLSEILASTRGKGVNDVFSLPSREPVYATWKCIAAGGWRLHAGSWRAGPHRSRIVGNAFF